MKKYTISEIDKILSNCKTKMDLIETSSKLINLKMAESETYVLTKYNNLKTKI
jgi:hypothetical protein